MQANRTQFVFQCGDLELQIDFISSSLSEKWDMTGWPVGFLSYQIRTEREKEHTVKILFDVDTEWRFGKREVNRGGAQGGRFT